MISFDGIINVLKSFFFYFVILKYPSADKTSKLQVTWELTAVELHTEGFYKYTEECILLLEV